MNFSPWLVLVLCSFGWNFCWCEPQRPCSVDTSVDISYGRNLTNGSVAWDGMVFDKDHRFSDDNGVLRGCVCLLRPCLRKCCPAGHVMAPGLSCAATNHSSVNPFVPDVFHHNLTTVDDSLDHESHFYYLHSMIKCQYGAFYMEANFSEYFLLRNGTISVEGKVLGHEEFCLDSLDSDNIVVMLAAACFDKPDDTDKEKYLTLLNALGMMISLPFLLATLLVYCFVPELQNLHGKALMAYVSSLFIAYLLLISNQLSHYADTRLSFKPCVAFAYFMYFFFNASFFWVNVMSFDIWLTFRGIRTVRSRRSAEKRLFSFYCLYAYGGPLILTAFVIFMDLTTNLPESLVKPRMGENNCWFRDNDAILLYFYLPIIIIVIVNILLFASTAAKILSIKRETAVLRNSESARHSQYEKDKQRFFLYLKLFLIMGVSWAAEWISFVADINKYLWILPDMCNAMIGVFIFVIFVYKKKVKNLLIKRYSKSSSTNSRSRNSSRFRSGNMITSMSETERTFVSTEEQSLKLHKLPERKSNGNNFTELDKFN